MYLRTGVMKTKEQYSQIKLETWSLYKKRMINVWSSSIAEARNLYATDFGISNAIICGINNGYKFYDECSWLNIHNLLSKKLYKLATN